MCHFSVSSTTLFAFLASSWCFVLIKSFLISCLFWKKNKEECILLISHTWLNLEIVCLLLHLIIPNPCSFLMNTITFLFTLLVIIAIRQFGKTISLNLFSELCGVGSWWGIITLDPQKFAKFLGIFYFGRGNLKVYDENVITR